MKRGSNIEALLEKSKKDFESLTNNYQASLNEKTVWPVVKVEIKNIFENLRSCLDYLGHEIFEAFARAERSQNGFIFQSAQRLMSSPKLFSVTIRD
jgi:hypothetical protein